MLMRSSRQVRLALAADGKRDGAAPVVARCARDNCTPFAAMASWRCRS
jgi:hypothetical protein